MKKINSISAIALAVFFVFGLTGTASAATAPTLGAATTFGVLSSTFTNSNTAPQTIITGDIGYTVAGAPVTPPITVIGTLHPADATHTSAGINQGTALTTLTTQTCTTITGPLNATVVGANAAGTFPPGCYTMVGALIITVDTTVTLDLTAPNGDGGNVWVFKSTGGGITTGGATGPGHPNVALAHGASECNVFWTATGATSLGANYALSATPTFTGTIIDDAGISLGHFANLLGRALAFATTVTTDANTITAPSCAPAPATFTVTKVVINDNGGTKVVADFPLFVGATAVVSGVANSFGAGAYAVTETPDATYAQTFSVDCDASGNITLVSGSNVGCTITNNDIAAPVVSSGGSTGSSHQPRVSLPTPTAPTKGQVLGVQTSTPGLPNAGFPPREQNSQGNTVALFSFLTLVGASLLIVSRKQLN